MNTTYSFTCMEEHVGYRFVGNCTQTDIQATGSFTDETNAVRKSRTTEWKRHLSLCHWVNSGLSNMIRFLNRLCTSYVFANGLFLWQRIIKCELKWIVCMSWFGVARVVRIISGQSVNTTNISTTWSPSQILSANIVASLATLFTVEIFNVLTSAHFNDA
jgi:hypothetical protein